jgi:hypothetical protein
MNKLHFKGELEIDINRGVIYFHREDNGSSLLRICRLKDMPQDVDFIDITHMHGAWYNTGQSGRYDKG